MFEIRKETFLRNIYAPGGPFTQTKFTISGRLEPSLDVQGPRRV